MLKAFTLAFKGMLSVCRKLSILPVLLLRRHPSCMVCIGSSKVPRDGNMADPQYNVGVTPFGRWRPSSVGVRR